MADNQLTSQVISEVEEQHVGAQRASQVISEVEEQHVGSQRASQIIAEVEWQWPRIPVAPGALTITGSSVTLLGKRAISLEPGAFTIDGQEVSFEKTRNLFVEPGEFVIGGTPVDLTYAVGGPESITVGSGALRIDGAAVGLDVGPARVTVFQAGGQVEAEDAETPWVKSYQTGGQVEAEDAETPWVKSYQTGGQVETVDAETPWVKSYQVGAQVEWRFPHPAINALVFSAIDTGLLAFGNEDNSSTVFAVL